MSFCRTRNYDRTSKGGVGRRDIEGRDCLECIRFDRMTFIRREATGIDSTTRRVKYNELVVIDNEPCDLSSTRRRATATSPSGTVSTTVIESTLKIYPFSPADVPDENDTVLVNGSRYRVSAVQNYRDAGSGDYRGSVLSINQIQDADLVTPDPFLGDSQ